MQAGKFDTDASALKQRITTHEKYGSHDLEEWAFGHLELDPGLRILELGCGTGKQTIPLAQLVGDEGRVLGVDVSQEALDSLVNRATELQIEARIDLLCAGLDEIETPLKAERFDRALACYSLYYARNPKKVFEVVHSVLNLGSIFFFCGPAKSNNAELKQFHYSLRGEQPPAERGASLFMEQTAQDLAREIFSKVQISAFENPLRFDSEEALHAYWRSYNLYDERVEGLFREAAAKHFAAHKTFETTKRVVGVQAIK